MLGVFHGDWSQGTALVLYWAENLLGSILIGARVALHARGTAKRGHESGVLGQFMASTLVFTMAHGVFLLVLLLVAGQQQGRPQLRVDAGDLVKGLGILAALMLAGLLQDLPTLAQWPFAAVRRMTDRGLQRVLVVHLALLAGMGAGVWLGLGRGVFLVFAGLKALYDLSANMPVWEPGEAPPRWFDLVLRPLFTRLAKGQDFDAFWAKTVAEQRRQQASAEEVAGAARRARR